MMERMSATRPDVFGYTNYREYLRDTYDHLKRTKPQFSYRYFARLAGFSLPNYLKLVMDGERNLTSRSIWQFAKALKLGRNEREFFGRLVQMNQARSEDERNDHYRALSAARGYLRIKDIERDRYEYYSNWYVVPIRELVATRGFREEPEWIARQLEPRITASQARKALELMLRLGLLLRGEDGRLTQADPVLSTGKEVRDLAVRNFHRAMIERAGEALERFPIDQRQVSSLTVPMTRERAEQIAQKLHEVRRMLFEAMCEPDPDASPDAVYQLNFQLFPLTRAAPEEDSS